MLDSLYLEQNVIGALLIQPECYEAAADLSPDDFLVRNTQSCSGPSSGGMKPGTLRMLRPC